MKPGTVQTLKVVREAPFGYFLSDGDTDVLLHSTEVNDEIELEQQLEVFLYQDQKGRLAATTTIPSIQLGKYDWAEVVEVKQHLGVFIHIGIKKDILISKDDLPELFHLWPRVGDRLYSSLKLDKKERLFGLLGTEEVMKKIAVPASKDLFNKNVTGIVYKLLLVGSFVITKEGYIGFIHESERETEPRLGQEISGRVIDVKADGSINLSLLPRAHEQMDDDARRIYEYLLSRANGSMPYGDKSHPDDIKKRFDMSKSAFKRALGKLMKEGKVSQKDGWTKIIK